MVTVKKWDVADYAEIYIEKYMIDDVLTISLIGEDTQGEKHHFDIIFETFFLFNLTDESYLLKFLYETKEARASFGKFVIFENSYIIKQFKEMTFGIYDTLKVFHYAIYTDNDCMDILSKEEPVIRLR